MNDYLFLMCDCLDEILVCYKEDNTFAENTKYSQEFYFNFYKQGLYNPKPSLWQRIRYAVRHLWTGEIHKDCIILNRNEAVKLKEYLDNKLNEH